MGVAARILGFGYINIEESLGEEFDLYMKTYPEEFEGLSPKEIKEKKLNYIADAEIHDGVV